MKSLLHLGSMLQVPGHFSFTIRKKITMNSLNELGYLLNSLKTGKKYE